MANQASYLDINNNFAELSHFRHKSVVRHPRVCHIRSAIVIYITDAVADYQAAEYVSRVITDFNVNPRAIRNVPQRNNVPLLVRAITYVPVVFTFRYTANIVRVTAPW